MEDVSCKIKIRLVLLRDLKNNDLRDLKNNPVQVSVPSLNSPKSSDFLMFSGGIEGKHWPEMG